MLHLCPQNQQGIAVTGMKMEGSPSSDMSISSCVILHCIFLEDLWLQSKPQDRSNWMLSSMFGLDGFYSRTQHAPLQILDTEVGGLMDTERADLF